MTQVNDPGKENDGDQDRFGSNNGYEAHENNVELNGLGESDTSSDEAEDQHHHNGYQLLPQDLPSSEMNGREGNEFADFESNFQSVLNNDINQSDDQLSGNPSIQTMIHQALLERNREEIEERVAIFSPSVNAEAAKKNDTICLDESKIETIKASMSKVKLQSIPPKWLHEMSEEDWNKMLQQKLKTESLQEKK